MYYLFEKTEMKQKEAWVGQFFYKVSEYCPVWNIYNSFQYLTTTIEPFKTKHMSDIVLKRLLSLDVFREIRIKKQTADEDLIIIEKGKAVDYFVLIVEGRVQATVGREELVFESGPFSFYGLQVLMSTMYSKF